MPSPLLDRRWVGEVTIRERRSPLNGENMNNLKEDGHVGSGNGGGAVIGVAVGGSNSSLIVDAWMNQMDGTKGAADGGSDTSLSNGRVNTCKLMVFLVIPAMRLMWQVMLVRSEMIWKASWRRISWIKGLW